MSVKTGDKVRIEYTGTLDDGTIFDSSEEHGRPLEFQVGNGHVIKGFDDAILGMKAGDEKQFSVSPAEAMENMIPSYYRKYQKRFFQRMLNLLQDFCLRQDYQQERRFLQ